MVKSWVSGVVMGRRRVNWKIFVSQSQQDLGIPWFRGTMGVNRVTKNRIQCSYLGDGVDIGANNCICELWGINQIEGKNNGLQVPLEYILRKLFRGF